MVCDNFDGEYGGLDEEPWAEYSLEWDEGSAQYLAAVSEDNQAPVHQPPPG